MSTQVLQITELTPKAEAIHQVSRAWAALPVPKGIVQRRVYEALDGSAVLELAALEKMGDLAALPPLLHANGKYTGRFETPQTIGDGKATAIAEFLAHRVVRAEDCWAFGDDVSDVPMLSAVGHPVAVIGDRALDSVARSRGWHRLHLATPGDLPLVQADLSALVGEAI